MTVKYECSLCHRELETTEEDMAEAQSEFEKTHGDTSQETVKVCDTCHRDVVIPWMQRNMPGELIS